MPTTPRPPGRAAASSPGRGAQRPLPYPWRRRRRGLGRGQPGPQRLPSGARRPPRRQRQARAAHSAPGGGRTRGAAPAAAGDKPPARIPRRLRRRKDRKRSRGVPGRAPGGGTRSRRGGASTQMRATCARFQPRGRLRLTGRTCLPPGHPLGLRGSGIREARSRSSRNTAGRCRRCADSPRLGGQRDLRGLYNAARRPG